MNNNIVDEIKSRCNIVDIIGRYVTLKRAGNSYKGLCPFHNEKTPSFVVSESKQFFNCFGCGESGDVISFVMKAENMDFHNAISKLAESCGIDMDKYGFKNESKKNEIYEMNRAAARYFYKNLTEKPNIGFGYMKKRGLDAKTIAKFGLGYAENSWSGLTDHLKSQGYKEEFMLQAGLISKSKNRYYDKFRNRIIFPIFNTRGKVIGFGGRTLGEDGPKYLNSPESNVFSKKNNLYGLNLTRQDINNNNYAIIVEGYMDLVSLYKNGVTNVAATLGTALTENQCQLLKRYTENIVLAYDADAAGQKAALRGIELLHKTGLKSKVLHVTDGKDPDEFIQKNGRTAFLELIDHALPYADYKLSVLKQRYDLSTSEGSIDFLKAAKEMLSGLSPVEADVYIKIISKETGISEGAIRREVNSETQENREIKINRSGSFNQSKGNKELKDETGNITLQKYFVKLLAVNPKYMPKIQKYESVFTQPACYRIYESMKNIWEEDSDIDIKKAADSVSPEDGEVFQHILDNITFPQEVDTVFAECIKTAEIEKMTARQDKILQMLNLLSENEEDKIDVLYKELMTIQSELKKTGN
ncbi:MAG: DNA primase [Firmicutes bacterium]|nr:DNA primase [Bacillota bacterium]